MKLVSVVLMAGFSRRMGKLKQHVSLCGRTFLEHIIYKLSSCDEDISKKIFVGQLSDELGKKKAEECGGFFIVNPNPEDGPLSSIRLAVKNLDKDSAIMLWPTDHPMISEDTVAHIIKAWKKEPDKITVPSDGEHRGHPSIFPAWCFELFYSISLDKGAKAVMTMFPERINHVIVNDGWITKNINTPELLTEAENVILSA